jgi:hypothetical protein
MSVTALITWYITAVGGLFLVSIWLIADDRDARCAAARLPVPAICARARTVAGGSGGSAWRGGMT